MRILLLQDDEDYAPLVMTLLSRAHHEVIPAITIDAALQVTQKRRIDLAILDMSLPPGAGLATCRLLRALPSELGVILVSPSHTIEDTVAAFSAGADEYIVKPFYPEEFLARVSSVGRRACLTSPPRSAAA